MDISGNDAMIYDLYFYYFKYRTPLPDTASTLAVAWVHTEVCLLTQFLKRNPSQGADLTGSGRGVVILL